VDHLTEHWTVLIVMGVVLVGAAGFFSSRIGVAAPLLLVVAGAALSLIPTVPEIEVPPEIILSVMLPPLLYSAAIKVPAADFRRNLRVILYLSVALVAISAAASALVLHAFWPMLGFALCFALGAVISPPDAVAATALGRKLGLPPRVMTILEGEGLMNDATALVLLSTALSAISTAEDPTVHDVTFWIVVGKFLWSVAVALVVGFVVGHLLVLVRHKLVDPVLDIALAIVAPFVAFLPAEVMGGSGVVSVVIAGLVVGNQGLARVPAAHRATESSTWGMFSMIVENGVFLTMGLQLPTVVETVVGNPLHLLEVIGIGLLLCVVLLAVRFAVLPPLLLTLRQAARVRERKLARADAQLTRLEARLEESDAAAPGGRVSSELRRARRRWSRRNNDFETLRDQRLGWRDTGVIGWAGMRGVVTVAAAQTLPRESPFYNELVLIAFVVAVATLIVQGGTLPLVTRLLKLQRDENSNERQDFLALVTEVTEAGVQGIEREEAANPTSDGTYRTAIKRTRVLQGALEKYLDVDPEDPTSEVAQYQRLMFASHEAQREYLAEARSLGSHSSEVIQRMQELLDRDEIAMTGDTTDGH